MADTKELVKKYWPWGVGAVVGLLVISRMGGGASSTGGLSAQEQAALQLQANAQGLQAAQIQGQKEAAMYASTVAGQVEWTLAQGAAGKAAAEGTAAIVAQLQQPTIAAIQSEGAQGIAALQAAAAVGAAGYAAQGQQAQALANVAAGILGSSNVQTTANAAVISSMFNSIASETQALSPTGVAEAASRTSSSNVQSGAAVATEVIKGLGTFFSDATLKENIGAAESALDKIEQMEFVSFDYVDEVADSQETPRFNVGLIAQQLYDIDPTLVRVVDGKLALNMAPLLMLALKGIQELRGA